MQQNIFGGRNYLQKLSSYQIDDVIDLAVKLEIIAKYVKALESGKIERTKEESIQADFMNKFFGDILGYDYNDPTDWNLEKEYKVITDGTKADGFPSLSLPIQCLRKTRNFLYTNSISSI